MVNKMTSNDEKKYVCYQKMYVKRCKNVSIANRKKTLNTVTLTRGVEKDDHGHSKHSTSAR